MAHTLLAKPQALPHCKGGWLLSLWPGVGASEVLPLSATGTLSYLEINCPLLFMPLLQVCVLLSMGGNESLNCLDHIICSTPLLNTA